MNRPLSGPQGIRVRLAGSQPVLPAFPAGPLNKRSWLGKAAIAAFAITAVALAMTWVADQALLTKSFAAVRDGPWLIAAFVVAYSGAFWLRATAWHHLIPNLGRRAAFSILQSAMFVNHLLPIKAGELVRPYLATRRGIAFGHATGSTLVARVTDYLGLFVLAAVLLPRAPSSPLQGLGALGVTAALLAIGVGMLLIMRRLPVAGWVPQPFREAWSSVRGGLREVTPRKGAVALLWSVPSWALESSVVLIAASSMGVQLGLIDAVAITAFTLLFQVFHFAPGGIGVYEATMTGALVFFGLPPEQALTIAVITHGLKFGYAFTVSAAFAAYEGARHLPRRRLARGGHAPTSKAATRFEVIAARLWNVVNEGKPFTPVFVLGTLLLLNAPNLLSGASWLRLMLALLPLIPLAVIFYRFDFPLRLRWALWLFLLIFVAAFRFFDPIAVGITLGLYFTFTIVIWGTVYYHLRIGTSWTNFTRFWRLALENPDPTSGNFLEQAPKFLLLVLLHRYLMENLTVSSAAGVELFVLGVGVAALLLHQWFFNWKPALSLTPTRLRNESRKPVAKRVIAIVIDGCRADRFKEARTPFLDQLAREGTAFTNMRTVYPARTVTAFSSMFTGASPEVHGMRSNFVPSLGVKCESIFDALRQEEQTGRLVGIAHLVDAFGSTDVKTVSAVNDNDAIDDALVHRAKEVMTKEDPELLVLQLLSVDQTGHARGSYNREYLRKIEATDKVIREFFAWCGQEGYLEDATVVVTSDHGQGIGIGGHGHLTESERCVPCLFWGQGIPKGETHPERRYLIDVAPTLSYLLGALPPAQSTGEVLFEFASTRASAIDPLAVIIPAYNEAESLPGTLARLPRTEVPGLHVIVVDDGSTDDTAAIARKHGAESVVRHDRNRGLGAALRTGLETARALGVRGAVYVDADGEYDPAELPRLIEPIEAGRADYVLGSRYLGTREGQPWARHIANRIFTVALSIAAGRRISDGQTGFRAFSKRALDVAEIVHDYNYAQVLTLDLLHKGLRMAEVPISWRPRARGCSFVSWQYLWRVPVGMAREMWHG